VVERFHRTVKELLRLIIRGASLAYKSARICSRRKSMVPFSDVGLTREKYFFSGRR